MIEAELGDTPLAVEDVGAGAALLQAEQRLEQRAGSQIERQRTRRAGRPSARIGRPFRQAHFFLGAAMHGTLHAADPFERRDQRVPFGTQPAGIPARQ